MDEGIQDAAAPAPIPANTTVVIFEAVNESLKEFFVGISTVPLTADEIQSRHQQEPPQAIKHWKPEHQIWYRCVDPALSSAEGPAFVQSYMEKLIGSGWKALAG